MTAQTNTEPSDLDYLRHIRRLWGYHTDDMPTTDVQRWLDKQISDREQYTED